MEITINPKEDSSITEEVHLELGDYTIFAGENNAGKTNLIKEIISEIGEENIIYIPAQNIDAQVEVKTTAAADPMRDAISKLLDIVLKEMPNIEGDFEQLFENIVKTFTSFDILNTELKLKPKDFEKEDLEKILRDAIASKILNYSIIDKYGHEKELGLNSVGQGIQRLIIVSIIQEIGKVRTSGDEILILFEEPEIYLHPKLKEKLYNSLVSLSEQPNIKVVITTHDPYFIELGKKHKIYNVFRDSESDSGATKCQLIEFPDGYLGYRSHSEINYLIFDLVSNTYFLELYEILLSCFDPEEKCPKCKKPMKSNYNLLNTWLIENNAVKIDKTTNPRLSKLRQSIGHKSKDSSKYVVKKEDIEELIKFIKLK